MLDKIKQFSVLKKIPLVYVILMFVLFYGCEDKTRKCELIIKNGSGWDLAVTTVECDSFQMDGTRRAFVWVGGRKMNVESNNVISPRIR